MSNIVSIDDLRKQFKEKLSKEEWEAFAEKQMAVIETYQKQIEILAEKNKQLEFLLTKNTSDFLIDLTPEETICLQQIRHLEKESSKRQLTLEEVKRLDLLVKNLKLIREESTIIVNNKKGSKLEEKELVAIIASESTDKSRGS